jgi:hypothetical protein
LERLRKAAPRLSNCADRRVSIACPKCGRRGSYSVARLVRRFGDLTLIRLLEELSTDCPKRKARSFED